MSDKICGCCSVQSSQFRRITVLEAALAEEQSERVDADTKVTRLYRELGQIRAELAKERTLLEDLAYWAICAEGRGYAAVDEREESDA